MPGLSGQLWAVSIVACLCLGATEGAAQLPAPGMGVDLADATGEAIYAASCANCHGLDGRGLDRSLVAFEEELPDFTDCDFAAREPDGDWIAVAHEGGAVRGFSEMMPAFRGALTEEQLARVMGYIRTLCTDPRWPRGELNLPRPLLTEKAYPEDEWVVEVGVHTGDDAALSGAFVYEQRFGPQSQLEVVIPYGWGWGAAGDDEAERANTDGVSHGLGDVILGVKHAVFHDAGAGTIVSLGGELILPTGDGASGLGGGGSAAEVFASIGQILPADAFLQGQAGVELPFHAGASSEAFGRLVLGASFARGMTGRTWSPMVEIQAKRDLESGADVNLDIVPQVQFSLNTRQHVLANFGMLIPARDDTAGDGRGVRLLAYVLLDWFDGGFFEGW